MDGLSVLSAWTTVLILLLQGCHAADTYPDVMPILTWPLGEGINRHELNTQSWAGATSSVSFTTGPATLDYSAMTFAGPADGSYVDLPVPYMPVLDGQDYSITFHMYAVSDGTVLHFCTATNGSSAGISEIKIATLSNGFIVTLSSSTGSVSQGTFSNMFDYNQWFHVVFERDHSNTKVKMYKDGISVDYDFRWWVAESVTLLPGTIRLGASLDGANFFTGRLTCLQFIGIRNPTPTASYDGECTTLHWPPLTTSTTTASTTSTTTTPSTTSTTTTPSTTSTTTTPPATSTTPTTTSTTPAPITTPALPPTMPTLPTIPTTSTSTTAASTTSTTTTAAPTTTSPAIIVNQLVSYAALEGVCNHFSATAHNATFQFIKDILGKYMADLGECAWLCVHNNACGTVVYSDAGECLIGVPSPVLKNDKGSTVYTNV